jgi:hypothetical protein
MKKILIWRQSQRGRRYPPAIFPYAGPPDA